MDAAMQRYSENEIGARGQAIFERDIAPRVRSEDERNFVPIAVETGDYEVDADDEAASERLLARRPAAQIWMRRVGSKYACRTRGARLTFGCLHGGASR